MANLTTRGAKADEGEPTPVAKHDQSRLTTAANGIPPLR